MSNLNQDHIRMCHFYRGDLLLGSPDDDFTNILQINCGRQAVDIVALTITEEEP